MELNTYHKTALLPSGIGLKMIGELLRITLKSASNRKYVILQF